jgi:hypothetical protein
MLAPGSQGARGIPGCESLGLRLGKDRPRRRRARRRLEAKRALAKGAGAVPSINAGVDHVGPGNSSETDVMATTRPPHTSDRARRLLLALSALLVAKPAFAAWPDQPIKPEDASQHGRLYFPTATEPAAVVASFPAMAAADPKLDHPPSLPIPADLDEHRHPLGYQTGFVAGWILNADDLATAKRLGIPGM